jgi:hypothetical protein
MPGYNITALAEEEMKTTLDAGVKLAVKESAVVGSAWTAVSVSAWRQTCGRPWRWRCKGW